jgi:hypothetical protein
MRPQVRQARDDIERDLQSVPPGVTYDNSVQIGTMA